MTREAPQGFVVLFVELARRYGTDALQYPPMACIAHDGAPILELRVPEDRMDEASQFVADLTVQIEDQYRENYSVLVLKAA